MTAPLNSWNLLLRHFESNLPWREDFFDPCAPAALEQLARSGALQPGAEVPNYQLCGFCCQQAVPLAPVADYIAGRCPDCGDVAADPMLSRTWQINLDWLLEALRTALRLPETQPIVPLWERRLWRLGIRDGVPYLLARHPNDPDMVSRLLQRAKLPNGRRPCVLAFNTALLRALGDTFDVLELGGDFSLEGDQLVHHAAGPVRELTFAVDRVGPFSPDFRGVTLPGESAAIALTQLQAAVFQVLWEANGKKLRGSEVMRRVGSSQLKPSDLFSKRHFPDGARAYDRLVRRDRQGQYWLDRATEPR